MTIYPVERYVLLRFMVADKLTSYLPPPNFALVPLLPIGKAYTCRTQAVVQL